MFTDWKKLATQLGLLRDDGESGGDSHAQEAFDEFLVTSGLKTQLNTSLP